MGEGKMVARTIPAGTPIWTRDATLNDSDKSFTVPSKKRWNLISVTAQITATATVGNRALVVLINDGTNNIHASAKTGSVSAGNTGVVGIWAGNVSSTTAGDMPLYDGVSSTVAKLAPIPNMVLPAGYIVRVYDTAAVDAAADDLTVVLHYEEIDV
jgi:hypothetical protein